MKYNEYEYLDIHDQQIAEIEQREPVQNYKTRYHMYKDVWNNVKYIIGIEPGERITIYDTTKKERAN